MKIQKPADAARAIRTQRITKGLTQQEVAEAVNITRQSLARIEKGDGGGAFLTYLRLFEYLGISIEAELDASDSNVDRQASEKSSNRSITQIQSASSLVDDPSTISNNKVATRVIELINGTLSNTESFNHYQRKLGDPQASLRQQNIDLKREQIIKIRLDSVVEESNPEV